MTNCERPEFFDEGFASLRRTQAELERRGYLLHAIPKEHAEGLVTGPLVHRLHTQIKKRGFAHVAGHVAITFSGFAFDEREIYEIAEARAYWQALDRQLPELPALLAAIPALRFNGPGQHVMLLGEVDAIVQRPLEGRYDLHVVEGPQLIADAVARIRQAGRKYHLGDVAVRNLVETFERNAGAA